MNYKTSGTARAIRQPLASASIYRDIVSNHWNTVMSRANYFRKAFLVSAHLGGVQKSQKEFEHEVHVAVLEACALAAGGDTRSVITISMAVLRRNLRRPHLSEKTVPLYSEDVQMRPEQLDVITEAVFGRWLASLQQTDATIIIGLLDGKTQAEIATKLGISRPAVTQRVSRLRGEFSATMALA
jgi:hypothetical protein